jgi:hypothetical protein
MNSPKEPDPDPGGRKVVMKLSGAASESVGYATSFGTKAFPGLLRRDARGMGAEGFIDG